MEVNESRIRYLEAIQRVIDRLSNTSFIDAAYARQKNIGDYDIHVNLS